ncbi:hypothetical protein G9A89_012310 [Geosiphon pyriformis]|nr:hypothetical protein G9A89_012310 [Geosiphon pyriformis]
MTETVPLSNQEGRDFHNDFKNYHTKLQAEFEQASEAPSESLMQDMDSQNKTPPITDTIDQSNSEPEGNNISSPTPPSPILDFEVEKTPCPVVSLREEILEEEELADCPCQRFSVAPGSATCSNCYRMVPAVAELYRERLQLVEDLDISHDKNKEESEKSEQKNVQLQTLQEKLVKLEDQLDAKTDELNDLQRAMSVLNEKYVDEIDKVAELQHSKDMVEGELEELSRSLFEQANGMVAQEAKQRYESEVQRRLLENQLQETRERLTAESSQLQELRERMEKMVQQQPETDSRRSSNHSDPSFRASIDLAELFGLRERSPDAAAILPPPTGEDGFGIDEELLAEFKDFLIQSPSVRIQKIHTIPFMRHCLDEDIDPCMRFGNNPRVSPRRIVDAIVANTCCIEEAPLGADKEFAQNLNSPIRNSTAKPMLWERFSGNGSSLPRAGCQCCGRSGSLPFQYRITTLDDWALIDRYCRDRLVAVCEFYVFIRNIRQGLYNNRKLEDLYAECLRLRLQIFYARLGALPSVFNTLGIKGTELASARKPSLQLCELSEKTSVAIEDPSPLTTNDFEDQNSNFPIISNGDAPTNGNSMPSSPTDPSLPVTHPTAPTAVIVVLAQRWKHSLPDELTFLSITTKLFVLYDGKITRPSMLRGKRSMIINPGQLNIDCIFA